MNSGSTYEDNVKAREDVSVIRCGLRIPGYATDYQDFLLKMELSEKEFMNHLYV